MSKRLRKARRGPLVLEEVREKDPEGRIVVHHRVVDTLARMRQAGTIDAAMLDAGREFQRSFILAQLDPLRAVDLLRVPGSGREPEPGNVQHGGAQPRAPGAAGAGRARQPRRLLRLARAGLRPVGAGVGAAPGLGRPAGAAGAGAGDAGGGAGVAGGALWAGGPTGAMARAMQWRSCWCAARSSGGTTLSSAGRSLSCGHPDVNSRVRCCRACASGTVP